MPQIFVIVAPRAEENSQKQWFAAFEQRVAERTEDVFKIGGENDVAITRIKATRAVNEADVQVEVRYTAGEDEYDRGKPFDPPRERREKLAGVIMDLARDHLPKDMTVSVWIKPIRDSIFKTMLTWLNITRRKRWQKQRQEKF